MLQVKQGKIVDSDNQPMQLRGTCIGGWLNMENFINGYSGTERGLRATLSDVIGPSKTQFFFERMADYFLTEDDIAFIKAQGANVVRLPLNYRHFENDSQPFVYLEDGFKRLDQVLGWCAKHGLYAILDLHAAQGWQNTDWHSDNAHRLNLLWQHRHFQDRVVALWEEFARRYGDNTTVAGYDLLNEPVANAPMGRYLDAYTPGWDALNALFRRLVSAVRAIDPKHIIFLEGDFFANYFLGLDEPFADNLVYSSHNYTAAGFGPGAYPGEFNGQYWDKSKLREVLTAHEGYVYTQKYNVPWWVGEFGAVYNGPAEENGYRLQALDDQLAVLNELGGHWTTWTYKDVGVMSWVTLNPESEYLQRLASFTAANRALSTDLWMGWLPKTPAITAVNDLADLFEQAAAEPEIKAVDMQNQLRQLILDNYCGGLLQLKYANCFKGLTENELDRILQSFAFSQCQPRQGLLNAIKNHTLGQFAQV